MDINFRLDILSQEDLEILKGGNATVLCAEEQCSASGDGAKYVCCIKIGSGKKLESNL